MSQGTVARNQLHEGMGGEPTELQSGLGQLFSDEDDDEDDGEPEFKTDDEEEAYGLVTVEGVYGPADNKTRPVSSDIKELFQYITRYTPQSLEIEHQLKPFIPDFMLAVGDTDTFTKIRRPDSKPDTLGLTVLDEPWTKQSDPVVLDLQLRAISQQTTDEKLPMGQGSIAPRSMPEDLTGKPAGLHPRQGNFNSEDDDEDTSEDGDEDDCEDSESGSETDVTDGIVTLEGEYDPAHYKNLQMTPDIEELFQYINKYSPKSIDLEHQLKPFIPAFFLAVGDTDAFTKIRRPDSRPDTLGLTVLDEPCTKQSDPVILDLHLRSNSQQTTELEEWLIMDPST